MKCCTCGVPANLLCADCVNEGRTGDDKTVYCAAHLDHARHGAAR